MDVTSAFRVKNVLGGQAVFLTRNANELIYVLLQLFVEDSNFTLLSLYANWIFAWLFINRSYLHGSVKSASFTFSKVLLHSASERAVLFRIISL